MPTLRHPHFPKVTVDVEPECVDGWLAQGWLPAVTTLPAPKPGPKKPPRSATTR